jgi:hypothetical protein
MDSRELMAAIMSRVSWDTAENGANLGDKKWRKKMPFLVQEPLNSLLFQWKIPGGMPGMELQCNSNGSST